MFAADYPFHENNKLFIELYDDIYLLIMEFVLEIKNYKSAYKKSLIDHEKIYKGLLVRDESAAREAMKNHIEWLIATMSKSEGWNKEISA